MTIEDIQNATVSTADKASKKHLKLFAWVLNLFLFLVDFVLFLWQIPQNFLGLVVGSFLLINKKLDSISLQKTGTLIFLFKEGNWGVSLGDFIFLPVYTNQKSVNHEYGHHIQSLILGPLYLIVIGIPSAIRNRIWYFKKLPSQDYYKGFPENWADRLGKVSR